MYLASSQYRSKESHKMKSSYLLMLIRASMNIVTKLLLFTSKLCSVYLEFQSANEIFSNHLNWKLKLP